MYTYAFDRRSYELFALETDRLRLSVYKKSRAAEVTNYLCRNRQFHKKWSQTHPDRYFTLAVQKKYLKYDADEYIKERLFPMWITLKDDPSTVIGRVSLFNIAMGGMRLCQLGYHLDEEYQHKGYMTEAVKCITSFALKDLRLHRIEAFILPDNERSLALIRKCGYRYEGTRRSYMNINGEWRDHETFYFMDEMLHE